MNTHGLRQRLRAGLGERFELRDIGAPDSRSWQVLTPHTLLDGDGCPLYERLSVRSAGRVKLIGAQCPRWPRAPGRHLTELDAAEVASLRRRLPPLEEALANWQPQALVLACLAPQ